MKLLILDAGHCLSLALMREASRRADTELLIEDALTVETNHLAAVRPDAVIIPPLSQPANAEPAVVIAHAQAVDQCLEACMATQVPMVWCVSDQLYEDGSIEPINEDVIPSPRDESLQRLVRVGDRIREQCSRYLIVRLGPLFALEGTHGWLNELLDDLMAGREVPAERDVILCPTSADAAAMALIGMLQQQQCRADAWGAYHLAGTEPVSAYTFASMVRTQLATRLEGMGKQVELGPLKALSHHHDQPLRRALNCRRVHDTFGVHQKPWQLEMERMLDAWCLARTGETA
ncbi:sugar nucleotide-binding protein [Pistricoccus aurantiacus]|uniref:dTDP-4-dehydrorhamnose reductase n=1 Tax=Pistricoccus aurantiacus TaxID=1883414 RepID=A0A5B8ST91_9GAMM|nr:sugar nucleotide-binding protein [Pistricoccus aurantiacus]QEA38020.1 sugar nucleotide-binding protein [Pistricoccus aurantiacus]